MRIPDVDTGRLLGLKYKLICHFKSAANMVGGGIRKLVNDADGPAFLERELIGLGVDGVPVGQSSRPCKWNGAH